MELKYETVSPLLKDCLKTISDSSVFKDFILVGGTSLSLQLGHRRSLDIDLFTPIDYGTMNTSSIKSFLIDNFAFVENIEDLDKRALGYSLRVGSSRYDSVKVDLFYTEKFIFPCKKIDGIQLADIREIAAMKMLAIGGPKLRQKDFWDINEISQMYTLGDMIKWGIERNPYTLTEADIISGFSKIDYVPEAPGGIDCFRGYYWDLIKEDLKELLNSYVIDRYKIDSVKIIRNNGINYLDVVVAGAHCLREALSTSDMQQIDSGQISEMDLLLKYYDLSSFELNEGLKR